jgi:hypothetical protein
VIASIQVKPANRRAQEGGLLDIPHWLAERLEPAVSPAAPNASANHHEVRLVQLCFDFYMIEAKPENFIGDRANDSDPPDEELRNDGIEKFAPQRSNRIKPPTQDRRREPLHATLAGRALLRLNTMATAHPRPLGIPRPQLPWLRPACRSFVCNG